MANRRAFLSGLLAAGVCPAPSWADAGDPAYLAAAKTPAGDFVLCGLTEGGERVFTLPLPGRGHAAAAHPTRPLAIAFARRPGTFAVAIDCATGRETARLHAPSGHHFTGHGVFAEGGDLLLTGENDYTRNRGMVGLWAATNDFRRIGEFPTGGVGPHDLQLIDDGTRLVVANGGIETHPDSGRAKLNLPSMRPNLTLLTLDGAPLHRAEPPSDWHMNSLRHLACTADGRIAVACQWQGDPAETPPLLATWRPGRPLQFHDEGLANAQRMKGYAGSIAASGDRIAITGPRGGLALIFDTTNAVQRLDAPDICGVAGTSGGFLFTTGFGKVLQAGNLSPIARHRLHWDNHLIAL